MTRKMSQKKIPRRIKKQWKGMNKCKRNAMKNSNVCVIGNLERGGMLMARNFPESVKKQQATD